MQLLENDRWLSDTKNVMLLKLTALAWTTCGQSLPAPVLPARDQMWAWTADGVVSWARAQDLAGPAAVLYASGVDGKDLLNIDFETLVQGVRLTPFAARKILAARDSFLSVAAAVPA